MRLSVVALKGLSNIISVNFRKGFDQPVYICHRHRWLWKMSPDTWRCVFTLLMITPCIKSMSINQNCTQRSWHYKFDNINNFAFYIHLVWMFLVHVWTIASLKCKVISGDSNDMVLITFHGSCGNDITLVYNWLALPYGMCVSMRPQCKVAHIHSIYSM